MSAVLDLAAGNAYLKEWYDGQKVQNLTYAKNPVLALLPKDEDTGGKYYPVPTQYETTQGRSANFSNAQSNQTPPQLAEFLVTRFSDYSIATIDMQTLKASMSSVGAFKQLATVLVDSAIRAATVSGASKVFRSGTGTIGQVSTTVAISTGVITLQSPAQISQFAVGQTLQANATDGGTPRSALGYVIARDISSGTITVSATGQGGAAGTPTSWGTSDYLLVQGDNNAACSGLSAWLPTTSPTSSDNFYGVNRSVDYRLYGIQYNGSGQPIEEALIDHSLLLAREGAMPDYFFTNFGSYSALQKALGTRREYVDIEGPAGIGFRGVMVDTASGPMKCLADRSCQAQTGYMVTLDTWKMISLGPVPEILKYEDRLEMLRVYNADQAECRVGGYYNLINNAPGWNGQISLSS